MTTFHPNGRRRLAATLLLLAGAATVVLGAGQIASRQAYAQVVPDICTVRVDKTAAPGTIRLGETVTVTLEVEGTCPPRDTIADVVLVIDRSYSMRTDKLDAAKAAALDFVNGVDLTFVQVAVVAISERPRVLQSLSSDRPTLLAAISAIAPETGTNLVDAFDLAARELTGALARPAADKVIVFMTDGRHRSGPDISAIWPLHTAATAAGIEIYAIALGSDADRDLLRRIATDAGHFYDSPTPAELAAIYRQIAGRVLAPSLLKSARVTDRVPDNMDYVRGSGSPVEPTVSPDGKTLTWTLADVKEPGTSLHYQVRPRESGTWPTNVSADLIYTDGFDHDGSLPFPVPTVRVTNPSAGPCICRTLYLPWRVSAGDRARILALAAAQPDRYYGWNLKADENKPGAPPYPEPGYDAGPNPRRTCLDLRNQNVPYHPWYNQPVWRAGCLVGPAPVP